LQFSSSGKRLTISSPVKFPTHPSGSVNSLIAVSLPAFDSNAGGAQFADDHCHIFGDEGGLVGICFVVDR